MHCCRYNVAGHWLSLLTSACRGFLLEVSVGVALLLLQASTVFRPGWVVAALARSQQSLRALDVREAGGVA